MKSLAARKILTRSGVSVANRGILQTGGRNLRGLAIGALCVAAAICAGCAQNASIARVEGSEPQRLSFGKPAVVKASFAEKMRACWFSGTTPMLGGYQTDDTPGIIQIADGATQVEQIKITSGKGEGAQVFVVQFNPFNENTLISTRNVSVPPDLAARMKRDVETWIFGRDDCGATPGAAPMPAVYTRPAGAPASSSQIQARAHQGDVPEVTASAAVVNPSQVTLSKASTY